MTVVSSQSDRNQVDLDQIQEIVLRSQRDPSNFARIYDLFFHSIYGYTYNRIKNRDVTEDLVSQIFLSALENLPRYKERGYFSAWLFSIARSKINDFFRKNGKERNQDIENISNTQVNIIERRINDEEILDLKAIISELPEKKQELLRLRYGAGLHFADIAAVMKKKEDAVKKALYRLHDELRKRLEVDHE